MNIHIHKSATLYAGILIAALVIFSDATPSFGQAGSTTDIKLYELSKTGDMKALSELRRRGEGGDPEARSWLSNIYFDGARGITKDFNEVAHWQNCPIPDVAVMATCSEVSYNLLPPGALGLLRKMRCDVGSNYDYGSKVCLRDVQDSAYQMCCHDNEHGPCDAVVIGKVGGEWKDLTASGGLFGYYGGCTGFTVLLTQHNGFHDICIPNSCSTRKNGVCVPFVWRFSHGKYRAK